MNNYTVYEHVNKIDGKRYVGITSQVPEYRWGANGCNYYNSPHFWNAIKQYGWDNFEHNIIATGLNQTEACEMEIKLIAQYDTTNKGYNILTGGDCAPMPPEVRKKLSIALLGNKNGLGKPCSREKAKKISEAQKGRHLTIEHRQKLSAAKLGKPHASPSLATRIKISNSHVKTSIYCYETHRLYESIQQCARELGLSASAICAACHAKQKHVHGYHFQYASLV